MGIKDREKFNKLLRDNNIERNIDFAKKYIDFFLENTEPRLYAKKMDNWFNQNRGIPKDEISKISKFFKVDERYFNDDIEPIENAMEVYPNLEYKLNNIEERLKQQQNKLDKELKDDCNKLLFHLQIISVNTNQLLYRITKITNNMSDNQPIIKIITDLIKPSREIYKKENDLIKEVTNNITEVINNTDYKYTYVNAKRLLSAEQRMDYMDIYLKKINDFFDELSYIYNKFNYIDKKYSNFIEICGNKIMNKNDHRNKDNFDKIYSYSIEIDDFTNYQLIFLLIILNEINYYIKYLVKDKTILKNYLHVIDLELKKNVFLDIDFDIQINNYLKIMYELIIGNNDYLDKYINELDETGTNLINKYNQEIKKIIE